VYKQQQEQQQQQEQVAENPFIDPPFSRIKTIPIPTDCQKSIPQGSNIKLNSFSCESKLG
jgi:hypothetical protein